MSSRATRIGGLIARLMDCRAKKLEDFMDIYEGMSRKQLKRDLAALVDVPTLNIKVGHRELRTWWRMEKLPAPTKRKIEFKECSKCPGRQPIANFGNNQMAADGHDWVCRKCRSAQRLEWVNRNKEKVNAKQRRNYRKRRDREAAMERAGQAVAGEGSKASGYSGFPAEPVVQAGNPLEGYRIVCSLRILSQSRAGTEPDGSMA